MSSLSPMQSNQISQSDNREESLRKCLTAYRTSTACIQHCLKLGGEHADPDHILILMNTSEICRTFSQFLLSESHYSHELCGITSRICLACADSCDSFDRQENEMMLECSSACLAFAQTCKDLEQ